MRQRLMPTISMEKALLQLRALKAKIYDDEILIQEPNKKIKDIVKKLNTHLTHGLINRPYFLTPASRSDLPE
jgi:hypothetical protein